MSNEYVGNSLVKIIYNPMNYRKQDINLGDIAMVEKKFHEGWMQGEDEQGNVFRIKVDGIYKTWGTVTQLYEKHAVVHCDTLTYGDQTWYINSNSRFNSSINFWFGEKLDEEQFPHEGEK